MKYVSEIFALNIEDSLETCGDWHTSALDWSKLKLFDSSDSLFGDWGIESNKSVPEHDGVFNVANTLRAVLDLMTREEMLGYLKGFRDDFFCTDLYNKEFFEKVVMLKGMPHWDSINFLMKREFMLEWDNFMRG